MRYRIAMGPIAGRNTLRLQVPGGGATQGESAKPLTATRDGFSLNAAVACRAEERKKLERVCRYVARPPLALERLGRDGDGLVVHRLERPFHDGTSDSLFASLDCLGWLAVLISRHPRGQSRWQLWVGSCLLRRSKSFPIAEPVLGTRLKLVRRICALSGSHQQPFTRDTRLAG